MPFALVISIIKVFNANVLCPGVIVGNITMSSDSENKLAPLLFFIIEITSIKGIILF